MEEEKTDQMPTKLFCFSNSKRECDDTCPARQNDRVGVLKEGVYDPSNAPPQFVLVNTVMVRGDVCASFQDFIIIKERKTLAEAKKEFEDNDR